MPFSFLRKRRNARKAPKPFVQGMTLEPGESAELVLAVTDELLAAIREGGKQTITQGPSIDDGGGKFHSDATLIVERRDGVQLRATLRLQWKSG